MTVLDASGVLNAFGFRFDRVFHTTPSVIEEIKDLRSRALVDVGIASGKLFVTSPSKRSIEIVEKKAREMKARLSRTDVEVVALALERNDEIWSDDKALQRVAEALGLKVERIIWG